MDEEDPRLFGLESDAIKRKREEVTLAELNLQLCEQIVAVKRRKIESYQFCMSALTDLSADDPRSRLRCADMIRYVAWGSDTQAHVIPSNVILSARAHRKSTYVHINGGPHG